MENKDKLFVGMDCVLVEHEYRKETKIHFAKVKNIGRKYFIVEYLWWDNHYKEVQFKIKDLKENSKCSNTYTFYFNQQEYEDKVYKEKMISKLRNMFSFGYNLKISIDQLKQIENILFPNDVTEENPHI